jgi:hypothetical protein
MNCPKLRTRFEMSAEAPHVHAGLCSVAIIVVLIATPFLRAQSPATQHVVVDLGSPKAAVKSMLAAVEMADGSALRDSFFASTDSQRDLVAAYSDLIVAARHLRDAARDKFAADNAPPPLNPTNIRDGIVPSGAAPEDQQQLDNAQVQIDGDVATVQLPNRPKPIKLQRTGGLWRIDLADYAAVAPSQLSEQTEVNHDLAVALDEASEEITAGKYASAQEAESAVQMKIHNVIAPQLKNLATSAPTTHLTN